jgi:hypothetical protein
MFQTNPNSILQPQHPVLAPSSRNVFVLMLASPTHSQASGLQTTTSSTGAGVLVLRAVVHPTITNTKVKPLFPCTSSLAGLDLHDSWPIVVQEPLTTASDQLHTCMAGCWFSLGHLLQSPNTQNSNNCARNSTLNFRDISTQSITT